MERQRGKGKGRDREGVLSQTYDNETREEERQPSPHPAANSSPELGRTDENIQNNRARSHIGIRLGTVGVCGLQRKKHLAQGENILLLSLMSNG